jgi:hypothetical protein
LNVFNSGKDAFSVMGTFDLSPKGFEPNSGESGFNPATHEVTVAYGKLVEVVPASCFKLVFGRWVCAKSTGGVSFIDINPNTGGFIVSGRAPGGGDALPTNRPFTLQLGHRIRGVDLICGTDNKCVPQHTP